MSRRRITLAALAALLGACAQGPRDLTSTANSTNPKLDRQLAAALQSRSLVLLGEVHDNAAQHALRARALAALLAGGTRPALLMEQFDRERQPELDRALSRAGASVDEVLAAGAPDAASMRGWNWPLYRPYIELALEYRLPIVAVNVSRADTRRAVASGLAALGFDAVVPPDIEAAQAQAIVEGHCGAIDEGQARRLVAAQVARDQFMARTLEAHAARGAVLLAGNGHVRRDVGVPRWLGAAARERSISIGLLEQGDANGAPAAYDLAFTTPGQPRPDPCEALRGDAPVRA